MQAALATSQRRSSVLRRLERTTTDSMQNAVVMQHFDDTAEAWYCQYTRGQTSQSPCLLWIATVGYTTFKRMLAAPWETKSLLFGIVKHESEMKETSHCFDWGYSMAVLWRWFWQQVHRDWPLVAWILFVSICSASRRIHVSSYGLESFWFEANHSWFVSSCILFMSEHASIRSLPAANYG